MDKEIYALEKAIRYMKYLQERVKILEEQTRKAEIVTKNSQVVVEVDDNGSSSTEPQQSPAIKARERGKNVLLRIHCEKSNGILVKIISEMEKLNLSVVNASVVSFGSLSLDINITAEKEKESSLTVNEIVQTVGDVLQNAA
ncbi:transcription factor NAI1-like [Olea europaea var. sylvestris]|uniref:transcription factor NAI1-like n=1 Tax=Olea europaea var. sylvestris TaxID=158386 RepID=UPI000C1CFB15|nr:transcription factor NAI1-like [Olea europaea var. sylvestris]